ncbi:MAG TPA: ribbon-helix-helix protein, CopG family [Desulfurococcales archaeon]|nr:ribbon-helix-helix protein, CopG family [Desulfurococcales archaeon]
MKVITFKIEEDLLARIDEYASSKGETRSEVIRRAIEMFLNSNGKSKKVKEVKVLGFE